MQGMLGDLIVFIDCLILIPMYKGHSQVILKHKVSRTTHKGVENWKIYTVKQIMICAEHEGILPKGPYPPCLRMADRALLASRGYPAKRALPTMLTHGR